MNRGLPLFAAALLLATAALGVGLFLAGNAAPAEASGPTRQYVPTGWALIPDGISAGDSFRLIFVTSNSVSGDPEDIANYNGHVQSAANGSGVDSHIKRFSSQFRVLASTGSVDARDNTATTYTSSDKGVPIYWLDGDKVADNYEDFYDGTWDSGGIKTQTGADVEEPSILRVWTGSEADGTKGFIQYIGSTTLGKRRVDQGRPGFLNPTQNVYDQPINGGGLEESHRLYPLYGLSPVLTVRDEPGKTGKPGVVRFSKTDRVDVWTYWPAPDYAGKSNIVGWDVQYREYTGTNCGLAPTSPANHPLRGQLLHRVILRSAAQLRRVHD